MPGGLLSYRLDPDGVVLLGFVDQQETSGKFYCDHLYLSLLLPKSVFI
jgi:hypothetical protein